MTDSSEIIEIQGTGEEDPLNREKLYGRLDGGSAAIADIIKKKQEGVKKVKE